MEFKEKAKVQIEHWISHSRHHKEDYDAFAKELVAEGYIESAEAITNMMNFEHKSAECLEKALIGLKDK